MVKVTMTDDFYKKFLGKCDFEDAGSFCVESDHPIRLPYLSTNEETQNVDEIEAIYDELADHKKQIEGLAKKIKRLEKYLLTDDCQESETERGV